MALYDEKAPIADSGEGEDGQKKAKPNKILKY
jgi:hypothetical protein